LFFNFTLVSAGHYSGVRRDGKSNSLPAQSPGR